MCCQIYSCREKYSFGLNWVYHEGRKKWCDGSDSTGKQGILTFDEPLEFNDGTVLECCLEIMYPSKKKKLTEKLPEMFELFALNCKMAEV